MKIAPLLAAAIDELNLVMRKSLCGTKIESISSTINYYAIGSAVASMGVGIIPGAGGLAAALAQTGFIWATYVKINKELGISMSKETAKFLGGAVATNLITGYGALMVGYVMSGLVSFIPIIGSFVASAANAALGYVMIYSCAVIYLKLITKMVKVSGTMEVKDKETIEKSILEIMSAEDMKSIFKEGGKQFKAAHKDGSFAAAKSKKFCTECGEEVPDRMDTCPSCGHKIK